MKYNKLIVSGCSFVFDCHDTEDLEREVHPYFIKKILEENPNKNKLEIIQIFLEKFKHYVNDFHHRTWPYLLSTFLNIEIHNFSIGGNSNPKIFGDVINYLVSNQNETNNLVIVGTTALNRINRWLDYKQEYINLHLKDFDNIENLYSSNLFDNPKDLADYQMLYLKYFHDEEESLSQVQKNIDLLKYICKEQNHKLFIFDNLIFSASRNKRIIGSKDKLKDKFIKDNDANLIYFKDNIFCFPEYVKTYDSKYSLSHLNTKDHEIFFNIVKEKL